MTQIPLYLLANIEGWTGGSPKEEPKPKGGDRTGNTPEEEPEPKKGMGNTPEEELEPDKM